jgi:hypothetical protein
MPRGYFARQEPIDRFMAKVEKTDSCWNWLAQLNEGGYGRFSYRLKMVAAHRWIFEHVNGPIPDGLQVDHLCRNRRCVNPAHMEAVTGQVNTLRGETRAARNAAKTHCPQGHHLEDVNGRRICRPCLRAAQARWRERQTARSVG